MSEKKKYDVIVVDPPWPLKKIRRNVRPNQTKMDYNALSVDKIKTLPIKSIASSNCLLFLWAPQKYVFIAKEVLESWGFNFLLFMVWKKTYGRSAGMPLYGFQWNIEFVLVGYLTKPNIWPKRKLIPLGFSAENEGHSVKPERFYEMVGVLGDNKCDLFARKQREGWDVWGNEVESTIEFNWR